MKNAVILSQFSIITFLLLSCSKQEIEIPLDHQDQNPQIEERSTYSVPSGWTVTGTSKPGCKLYKKGSHYMQVIELDKGAKVRPFAYPVLVNDDDEPIGSGLPANNNLWNPYIFKETVANWWINDESYLPSTYKLYSITNGTFFDRLGHPFTDCSYACKSVYPVKDNNLLMVCGHGGNSSDLSKTKRAFVVSVNSSGVQTPNVISFNDGGNSNYYSFTNISSVFSSYKWAIVGFKSSDTKSPGILTGRTAIGTFSKNVYILTTSSAYASTVVSLYSEWGVAESKVVMMDGSDSSQLNVLGVNKISETRCVGSILVAYWGT